MGLLEFLKKTFGDEKGTEIFNKIKGEKDIELLVDSKDKPRYVEKQKLDDANTTIKDYKNQIKDRDTQLETLQGKVKDNEELSKEIETLKTDNSKITKDFEEKLNKQRFEYALDRALTGAKAKNAKAVKALLNTENIKLDGENLLGLNEQLETLKESDAYLFNVENKEPDNTNLGGTGSFSGSSKKDDKTLSFGETLAKQKTEMAQTTEAQSKFFE